MSANPLVRQIAGGGKIINGWLSLPCAYSAEIMGHQGYDSLTIDLQHGAMGYETAYAMLQALAASPSVPLVRVPWHDPGLMMKLLDAGARGIICPMVNSVADAEAFVAACRYPPSGFRSFGPNRAVLAFGSGSSTRYQREADEAIVLFAMIETEAGLAACEQIAAVPGLDGLYIGPGDLSLSLGAPPTMAPTDGRVLEAMARIRTAAKSRRLIAAVHTDGPATARKRFAEGFDLATLQGDARLLSDAATAQVAAVRAV